MQLDLTKEISILQVNYYHQLELLGATFAGWKRDSTFRPTNWILAFPYDFVSLKENVSMTLIREIALCNALYGTHIFKEDKVLDNYNLPEAEYRSCILDMCRTVLNVTGDLVTATIVARVEDKMATGPICRNGP